MGKFYKLTHYLLGLFCASAFAVQALAAERVNVTIDANTGRVTPNASTYRVAGGWQVSPAPSANSVTSVPSGLRVDAGTVLTRIPGASPTAYAPTTFATRFFAGTQALRNAAGRCLTSFRCNVAAMAASQSLDAVLSGYDLILDNSQAQPILTAPQPPEAFNQVVAGVTYSNNEQGGAVRYDSFSAALAPLLSNCPAGWYCNIPFTKTAPNVWTRLSNNGGTIQAVVMHTTEPNNICPAGSFADSYGCVNTPLPRLPVRPSKIQDYMSTFNPEPADFEWLSGGIDLDDDGLIIEGEVIPSLPAVVVSEDYDSSTGQTTRTTTQTDFEWQDNPGAQPELVATEFTNITIFNEFGDTISSSTSTSTSRGGGGGGAGPIDCDFMPTVCRFINWFTEPDPEMLNEPDLKQLMETFDPDESSYDFGPDTMACPEPYTIAFSLLPSVEVSLQPICDVVDRVRPLVLALAYIFSGILLVRNI